MFVDTQPTGEDVPVLRHYYVVAYEIGIMQLPLGSTWIYEESNGLPGLQRGAEDDYTTTQSCGHGPDTLVF